MQRETNYICNYVNELALFIRAAVRGDEKPNVPEVASEEGGRERERKIERKREMRGNERDEEVGRRGIKRRR